MRYAILLAALIATPAIAKPVSVKPYVKKDGTFVMPHTRSAPNRTTLDNWSTAPNINPYNGKTGKRQPDFSYPPPPKPAKSGKSSFKF